MYCPECKSEYLEGVTHCIDCGAELVEFLDEDLEANLFPSDMPHMNDLLVYRRYPRAHEAEVVRGLLEANGIPAITTWDDWGRMDLQRNSKFRRHGIRLLIREEDKSEVDRIFRDLGIHEDSDYQPYAEASERPEPSQSEAREQIFSRIMLVMFIVILLFMLIQYFY